MTATEWALGLQVAGFAFELGGIGVTVREIVERSRTLTRFEEADRIKHMSATLSAGASLTANATVLRASEPTLDERVAMLEETVSALPARMERTAKEAAERAGAGAKRHADDLHKLSGYELDKVKTGLREALTGGRLAMVGVGLLVVGLVFQAVGSIIGTVTTSIG